LVFGVMLAVTVVVNVAVFVFNQVVIKTFDFAGLAAGLLGGLLTAVLVGAINYVLGALIAWLYNLVAGVTGGLVIELEDAKEKGDSMFAHADKQE
jgi:hypothetical protein